MGVPNHGDQAEGGTHDVDGLLLIEIAQQGRTGSMTVSEILRFGTAGSAVRGRDQRGAGAAATDSPAPSRNCASFLMFCVYSLRHTLPTPAHAPTGRLRCQRAPHAPQANNSIFHIGCRYATVCTRFECGVQVVGLPINAAH
jgi:hypothetical protein